jgi:hypothetical protein
MTEQETIYYATGAFLGTGFGLCMGGLSVAWTIRQHAVIGRRIRILGRAYWVMRARDD